MKRQTREADSIEAGTTTAPLPFYPALEGLRGLSVFAVLLFHLDYRFIGGGFLGVSTFFTLSGFLITGLLLHEFERGGRIDLLAFWSRRFRRLMPAALAGLLLIVCYGVLFGDSVQALRLRGDGLSALFYLANWWFIFTGAAYADMMGSPSPVQHFWSLNIEEQFYFVYPIFVFLLLGAVRCSRRVFALVLAAAALASLAWMASLSETDVTTARMYYGTDTRCGELLLGGILAVLISGRSLPSARGFQQTVSALGLLGLVVSFYFWATASVDSEGLYRGGLGLYACASVAVIAASTLGSGPVVSLLSLPWLRYTGRISYGVYTYHWPIFLWLSPERTGMDDHLLSILRVGVTMLVAAASSHWLEEPIRRRRILQAGSGWIAAPLAFACVALGFITTTDAPDGEWWNDLTENISQQDAVPGSNDSRLRILVVGDSVAENLYRGLKHWGQKTGHAVVSKSTWDGCGIARGHRIGERGRNQKNCDNWDWRFSDPLDKFRPDVVVVYTYGWDVNARQLPAWESPRVIGDPDYDRWLRAEFDQAVTVLSSRGAKVVWISPLCVENPKIKIKFGVFDPARVDRLRNNVIWPMADARPDELTTLDLFGAICPDGRVSQEIDGIKNFRPDGVHFSSRSRRWVGRWIGERILELGSFPREKADSGQR